jgi:fermentation-respiration switch protein FrsA (DUF1100 family)
MPATSRRNLRYWRNLALFGLSLLLLSTATMGVWLAHQRGYGLVHPKRILPKRTPADVGITQWYDVSFQSEDGLALYGWYVPAQNGATIILVHGLGGHRAQLLEVDPGRIGLLGHSMGGATAIRAAARYPQVRALVAESTFTSIEDNVSESITALTGLPPFPFAPLVVWFGEREAGIDIGQVSPVDAIGTISPRPVLIVHGELDPVISADNAPRLYAAAGEPKELYLIPNAEHGGLPQVQPEEYRRRVVGFFDRYLLPES